MVRLSPLRRVVACGVAVVGLLSVLGLAAEIARWRGVHAETQYERAEIALAALAASASLFADIERRVTVLSTLHQSAPGLAGVAVCPRAAPCRAMGAIDSVALQGVAPRHDAVLRLESDIEGQKLVQFLRFDEEDSTGYAVALHRSSLGVGRSVFWVVLALVAGGVTLLLWLGLPSFSSFAVVLALFCLGAAAESRAQLVSGARDDFFRIATGPADGTLFAYGSALAVSISAARDDTVRDPGARGCLRQARCGVPGLVAVAQTRGGALESLQDFARGEVESAITPGNAALRAYEGNWPFRLSANPDIRTLGLIGEVAFFMIVRADGSIPNIYGLIGKTIAIGPQGAAERIHLAQIFRAHGLLYRGISEVELPFFEALEALDEGVVDAVAVSADRVDVATLGGAALLRRFALLSFDFEQMTRHFSERRAMVRPVVLEPGDHPFLPRAAGSLLIDVVWVVSSRLPDYKAFQMTRALWHQRTQRILGERFPDVRLGSVERAPTTELPLHEGARRWYDEARSAGG